MPPWMRSKTCGKRAGFVRTIETCSRLLAHQGDALAWLPRWRVARTRNLLSDNVLRVPHSSFFCLSGDFNLCRKKCLPNHNFSAAYERQHTQTNNGSLSEAPAPNFGPETVPQLFPFYEYNDDGSNRRENITDWALNEFRTHYSDPNITKWDIFHYVYAVLHHPEYRERYAANLKRELPRIPFVGRAGLQSGVNTACITPSNLPKASAQPVAERHKEKTGSSTPLGSGRNDEQEDVYGSGIFWNFVEAGHRLADLHVNYEHQPEYPRERVEKGQLNWRVEKMRLSKDKTTLVYNDFLTLKGIPPETYDYRVGNRSALEWVIDHYQVSTDKRSGIVNDPNRVDDPEYCARMTARRSGPTGKMEESGGSLNPSNLKGREWIEWIRGKAR